MSRIAIAIVILVSVFWSSSGLAAGIGLDQALGIAKEAMYAQHPELNDPRVKILSNTASDKIMLLVFSNPVPLNGETFWNIDTQVIWYGDTVVEYHYVGGLKGPRAAPQPAGDSVDPAIRQTVLAYLSYLAESGPLNPNLKVKARPVTVHLFTFHRKDGGEYGTGVTKVIGVDDTGATFRPNPFSTLVPKPSDHPIAADAFAFSPIR